MNLMNISPVLSVKNLEKSKVSFSPQKGFQIDHEGKNTTASMAYSKIKVSKRKMLAGSSS
jgi:hypothetical protein